MTAILWLIQSVPGATSPDNNHLALCQPITKSRWKTSILTAMAPFFMVEFTIWLLFKPVPTKYWSRRGSDQDKRVMWRVQIKLTACSAGEHGDRLKNHLVEQQGHRLVIQFVPQEVTVVIDISPLARDGHALEKQMFGGKLCCWCGRRYMPERDFDMVLWWRWLLISVPLNIINIIGSWKFGRNRKLCFGVMQRRHRGKSMDI